jgi:hypothetical protein
MHRAKLRPRDAPGAVPRPRAWRTTENAGEGDHVGYAQAAFAAAPRGDGNPTESRQRKENAGYGKSNNLRFDGAEQEQQRRPNDGGDEEGESDHVWSEHRVRLARTPAHAIMAPASGESTPGRGRMSWSPFSRSAIHAAPSVTVKQDPPPARHRLEWQVPAG